METLKAVAARRSVRKYLDKAVEDAKLEALVEAANSGAVAGPFQITVLLNRELLAELDRKTLTAMQESGIEFLQNIAAQPGYRPLFGVPLLLVFSAPEANPYGGANCAIAAATATIAAVDLGLGSCYVVTPTLALAKDADLCARIGLPEGFKAACCVTVGYADAQETAPRQPRQNVNHTR